MLEQKLAWKLCGQPKLIHMQSVLSARPGLGVVALPRAWFASDLLLVISFQRRSQDRRV